MKWLEYRIDTTEQGLEAVYACLEAVGVSSIEMRLSAEHIAADLNECRETWDFADGDVFAAAEPAVIAYIPYDQRDTTGAAIRTAMAGLFAADVGLDLGTLGITVSEIEDQDWAESWKKTFKQLPIGERFLICPSWETPTDAGDRAVVMMDSGLAFGTGQHETTQMCLRLYERSGAAGRHVLDAGCGSGILSIAALIDGAADAVAVDIDEKAVETAEANAKNNGISVDRVTACAGDLLHDAALRERIASRRYNVIFANIVADVIIGLSPYIPALLDEGGVYIVSGIINDRRTEVAETLTRIGFEIVDSIADGEWCAMLARIKRC